MQVTERMKEKIEWMKEYFISRTKGGHIISDRNGFIAVGILKEPKKHLPYKKTNSVLLYSCGFNEDGSRIVENSVEMTRDEAEGFLECFRIALKGNREGGRKEK